jgi:hypothetical protein
MTIDSIGRRNGFRLVDMTGQSFGRLTVIGRAENAGKRTRWLCRCECGGEKPFQRGDLLFGRAVSCGCYRNAVHTKHGLCHTSEYSIWAGMNDRCSNPNNNAWKYYGGRGIKVCDRWRASFEAFFADIGPRPTSKHSIDRINNDGNYEPGNVRWATATVQANNKRQANQHRRAA